MTTQGRGHPHVEELFAHARECSLRPDADRWHETRTQLRDAEGGTGLVPPLRNEQCRALLDPSTPLVVSKGGLVGWKGVLWTATALVGLGVAGLAINEATESSELGEASAAGEPSETARASQAVTPSAANEPSAEPSPGDVAEATHTATAVVVPEPAQRSQQRAASPPSLPQSVHQAQSPATVEPHLEGAAPQHSEPPTLMQELASLRRVDAALKAGQAQRALSLLRQARISQLTEHAAALRAEATCRATPASRGNALRSFLRNHAASPFEARVRGACAR